MRDLLKEAAREAPNHLALLSKKGSLTFGELDKWVDQCKEEMLIAPASPTVPFIVHLFSAWRRGRSLFPINEKLPNRPTILLPPKKYESAGVGQPPLLSPPASLNFSSLAASAPVTPDSKSGRLLGIFTLFERSQYISEPPPSSLLLLTSGSTGTPKIAVLSLANLVANAKGALAALDLRPKDQWRLTLPLYHVGGIAILIRCLLARATVVLDDSPHITHLSCVPTHLYRATPVYKNLRCLLVGGAPIPSYPFPIQTTYGLTEMSSMVTLNGKVLPEREVRLAEDGEIWVRGPCLFQGYLGETPQRDWFQTGDLGRYEKGELQIVGRKDWMFISGGENIQPEEIERHLLAMPEVLEAIVLPKEDPEFGMRPVAVVRAKTPFTLEKMKAVLSEKLPKYKIPIALYFVDQMPTKNTFKIDRFNLLQMVNSELNMNSPVQKKTAYL